MLSRFRFLILVVLSSLHYASQADISTAEDKDLQRWAKHGSVENGLLGEVVLNSLPKQSIFLATTETQLPVGDWQISVDIHGIQGAITSGVTWAVNGTGSKDTAVFTASDTHISGISQQTLTTLVKVSSAGRLSLRLERNIQGPYSSGIRVSKLRIDSIATPAVNAKSVVIIDADTTNEIDDYFAIVRALADPNMNVIAVNSSHHSALPSSAANDADVSHAANIEILRKMGLSSSLAKPGSNSPMVNATTPTRSVASDFIVNAAKALAPGIYLDIVTLGSLTNIASAILQDPSIAPKLRVHIVGFTKDANGNLFSAEFNADHDQHAVTALLNSPNLQLNIMQNFESGKLSIGPSTVRSNLRQDCLIESYLLEKFNKYVGALMKDRIFWDVTIIEALSNPNTSSLTTTNTSYLVNDPHLHPHATRSVSMFNDIDSTAMESSLWTTFSMQLCKP